MDIYTFTYLDVSKKSSFVIFENLKLSCEHTATNEITKYVVIIVFIHVDETTITSQYILDKVQCPSIYSMAIIIT